MGVLDEAAAEFIPQSRGEAPGADTTDTDRRRRAEEAALNWKRCKRARIDAEKRIQTRRPACRRGSRSASRNMSTG